MKKFRPRVFPLILIIFIVASAGCTHYASEGGKAVGIIATSEAFKNFSGEYENTEYFLRHKPKTIAVLPFQDLERKLYSIDFASDDPAGVVRKGMYNHIASLPFKDLEIFDIDKRLKNEGLTDSRKIYEIIEQNPKKLKSILGVEAVITGEVTNFDRIFAGIYSQVAVGCEVRMWDLNTGKMLWRAKQVARAHAGGLSLNPIGLAMATVASVWNLRASEMLSQTDELFREIVSTMDVPKSALASQIPPPRIDLFAVMNSGAPFTMGKQASFRIIGDPGCNAYVDLGDFKSSLELAPVAPGVKEALRAEVLAAMKKNYKETGHELTPELIAAVEKELASREIYEGTYRVEPDEQAYGLIAKSYLVNSSGGQTTAIDPVHYVDIDSRPPKAATGLSAQSLDNKVKLMWSASSEEDLAKYEVWSSPTPLSGYTFAAKSEKNETVIGDLPNFTRVYFQVRAVDKAANSGKYSDYFEAMPLPDPGIYDLPKPGPALSGTVDKQILLVAEKNPYTILSDLLITNGGVLYIEPGVELQFAPDTGLVVEGGDFLAYGSKDKPIHLSPKAPGAEPGSWKGIQLSGVKQSTLRNVIIKGASTGISIKNSAPTISSVTVTRSSQAGLYLHDNARPIITCSVFSSNEGQGGIVIDGEGLAPVFRNNRFENNSPFQVQSYTPLEIDMKDNYWGKSTPEADWFLGNIVWEPALDTPPTPCNEK